MRQWIPTLLLAFCGFALSASAATRTTHGMASADADGVLLNAKPLNASASQRRFTVSTGGYSHLVLSFDYTYDSATDFSMTCTKSVDESTTDTTEQTCETVDGKCVGVDDAGFLTAVTADKIWSWTVDVGGYNSVTCTVAATSGVAADLITIKGNLIARGGGSGGAGGGGGTTHQSHFDCVPAAGAPIKMACQTGADADSGALTTGKLYEITCLTDAWLDFAAAASNAAADDKYMPALRVYRFGTGGPEAILHVSGLSVAVNGACYITECN